MKTLLVLAIALGGCDWSLARMNDQPRCEPGDRRPWLPDQRCDQPTPAGTVAWRTAAAPPAAPAPSRALILRGADRFARTCAACHGPLGDGRSAVARDMALRKPPSLHDAPIAGYPDQRIYDAIARGYGMMPSYAYQLPEPDRWAVVYFVRVLQRAQRVALDQLPEHHRREAASWLR